MARILYISAHAVLEHSELTLLTQLGHEVFALNGCYQNPHRPVEDKRPAILEMQPNQQLLDLAMQSSRANIHDDLFKWADIIIIMHKIDWIGDGKSWLQDVVKRARKYNAVVVWRTIGQSHSHWERIISQFPTVKILRYSPMERNIPGFAGEDALIRFSYSAAEYFGWTGGARKVHVFGQSIKERAQFCGYPIMEEITRDLPRVMYGTRNTLADADRSEYAVGWAGGALTHDELKKRYQKANVAFYAGTVPASYTLTFIEMLLTGTPLVCVGPTIFNCEKYFPGHNLYEIPSIIRNWENGFCSDSIKELKQFVRELLYSESLRKKISRGARETALQLFDHEKTRPQWNEFINSLGG